MAGMMHVDLDTPNGVAKARVDGQLKFDQAAPILIDSITRVLFQEKPINSDSYANIGLPGIIEHYFARSGKLALSFYMCNLLTQIACAIEKLNFDYQWLIQPLGSQYKTEIIVDVNIPIQQEIQYIPGVLETLKIAWT